MPKTIVIGGARARKGYKSKKVPKSVKTYVTKKIDNMIEDKFIHNDLSAISTFNSIGSTWQNYALCTPPQNVSASGRTGRSVRVKGFELYGILTPADSAGNIVRIIAHLNTSATPFLGPVFDFDWNCAPDNNTGGALIRKYYDKFIPLRFTSAAAGDAVALQKVIHIKKRFKKPLKITWATDSDTYFNHMLYISVISDSGVVAHPGFTRGFVRCDYEDA